MKLPPTRTHHRRRGIVIRPFLPHNTVLFKASCALYFSYDYKNNYLHHYLLIIIIRRIIQTPKNSIYYRHASLRLPYGPFKHDLRTILSLRPQQWLFTVLFVEKKTVIRRIIQTPKSSIKLRDSRCTKLPLARTHRLRRGYRRQAFLRLPIRFFLTLTILDHKNGIIRTLVVLSPRAAGVHFAVRTLTVH